MNTVAVIKKVHWRFRVRVRRSTNVTKGTIGGMTSNEVRNDIIVPEYIIVKLKKEHPFRVGKKVISPKFVQEFRLFPANYNIYVSCLQVCLYCGVCQG
jgi:hypothetical protein